jgi:hypothetical protein
MSQDTNTPIWKSLVIAIVPLFVGSLLFSGIPESFKIDAASRKEMLNDFYRPMRETQSDCQKKHNTLFLQYGQVVESYQLMLDELNQLAVTDNSKMTREYQVLLESILSTHSKVGIEAKESDMKLEICRIKLFQKYAELSLVTGTYEQFINLSKNRSAKIDVLYAKRKSFSENMTNQIDIKDLMQTLRNFLQSNLDQEQKKNDYSEG